MVVSRQIYFGRKSTGKGGSWISFEDDPRLSQTKWNIYGRCVPCMEDLWQQLDQGRTAIRLKEAFDCWKVVVALEDEEQCLKLLEIFERIYLTDHAKVRGRYGSSTPSSPSQAVIFQVRNVRQRDQLRDDVVLCARQVNPQAEIFLARACTNLYGELLGPFQEWDKVAFIHYPEKIGKVKEKIKRLLYYT